MAEDYYDVLGLSRAASEDEINKAYRDLARKHHPDLNPDDAAAKKKFQEVTAAFEVLSDPKKREQYDRFGPAFEQMKGGGAGGWPGAGGGQQFEFDLGDLFGGGGPPGAGGAGGFADIFKHFGGGAPPRGRSNAGRSTPSRGEDIQTEITVPFRTAVSGGEAALSLQRSGGKTETLTVKIPAGLEDGRKIRLRGQGNPDPMGGDQGDLLLTVHVAPHPQFRRQGARLEVSIPVTLAEAARGAKVDLPTPKGVITLTIPPGTSSGTKLRVKGHGVAPAGDLFAEVLVVVPAELSDADREAIAKISDRYPQSPRDELRW